MKQAVFRFDIDTHVGMRIGVPPLLHLARDLGVPFTFFVNCGRAMSLRHSLIRRTNAKMPSAAKPGLRRKLGLRGIVETVLLNPRVAGSNPSALRRAAHEDHELGLHGGRNHASWQQAARTWTDGRLRSEVSWGLGMMVSLGLEPPKIFSSPGWQGSARLEGVLSELGFDVVADAHAHGPVVMEQRDSNLLSVSTNLLGEPGGVGYVSHGLAGGSTTAELVERFTQDIESQDLIVIYDHPVVAGREGLRAVRGILETAMRKGYTWTTLGSIARQGVS